MSEDAYGQEEYEMEWPEDGGEAGDDAWGSNDGGDQDEITPAVEVENLYYEAEGRMKDEPVQALE